MFLGKLITAVVEAPARTRREARVRALIEEGASFVRAGDAREAEKRYARALELEPGASAAHAQMALLYTGLRRMPEALPHFRAAHAAAPLQGHALESFVRVLLALGGHDEALRVAQASAQDHADAASWFSLGLANAACHRYGEALEAHRKALAIEPDADRHAHCGIALQYLGRLAEAQQQYEQALAIDPTHAVAAFHRSLTLLARGRYAQGWRDYELRLASADAVARPRRFARWDGSDPAGRTILVYGEQGLGDEIMFASCVRDLVGVGARCVIECDPRLQRLFARSFPQATVYGAAPDKRVPEAIAALGIDFELPIGSLPLYYRQRSEDFPDHDGYLRADPQRVAAWRTRLAALGPGVTVGVSWRGGTHASRQPLRSIPLEAWLPILRLPGVRFVSLQYGDAAGPLDALFAQHGVRITHWPEAIGDYDETAALVTALDLTVTVCTSVVHLAGALGKAVWVMAPAAPEWRYGAAGERMVWYPSARVFRQREGGGWDDVVAAVAAAVRPIADTAAAAAEDRAGAAAANREGAAFLASRNFTAAQSCFERALALAPSLVEARVNLAIAVIEQGHGVEGERHLRAAIAADPQLLAARENLAILLASRYDHDGAAAAWDEVLAFAPEHAGAHAAKAYLALREGRLEDARRLQHRACALGADPVPLAIQEASMRAFEGDVDAARALIDGLRGRADDADLDWELAMAALANGRFAEGWPLYEARLTRKAESPRRPYPFPEWNGAPLDGTLLILAEQGIGDEIMFASCYPDALARAARCIIECEPRLERLFTRSFPGARVVGQARGSASAALVSNREVACQIHAGSLPRLFRRSLADFPRHDGYLSAEPDAVAEWHRRLRGKSGKRVIGIAWSGGLAHTRRSLRSIAPDAFARAMAIADAQFVSLQHDDDGTIAAELARCSGRPVHVFHDVLADFDDMAALTKSLDAVLTACSSVVHLSGALGVPTIVLTPKHAEWRYLRAGSSLPWYPSVRLVRQRESGDWQDVIEEARTLLARLRGTP
ncbi:MAG TPA: tetratricopeptide repeat protein [Burkholderiales bacterium]|nr:tetratricopeptide repeat protein [Burkholderiales bacterium]